VRRASRHRKSGNTSTYLYQSLVKFDFFCPAVYGHSRDEEIQLLKESETKGEKKVYETLNDFIDWLDRQGLRQNTISGYYYGLRSYLLDHDVTIVNEIAKRRVKLPMNYEEGFEDGEALDKATIEKLIEGTGDKRLKALIYLLASSGMRIGEAIQIRMRDCSLDESPPRIVLHGQKTKNGQPRETYMTLQAAKAIKDLRRGLDDYVFDFMEVKIQKPESERVLTVKGGPEQYKLYMAEKKASQMFLRLVKRLNLDKEKTKDHRVHTIHFHAFRSYFSSKASDPDNGVGPIYTKILLGHKSKDIDLMFTYDKNLREKLRKMYHEKLEEVFIIGTHTAASQDLGDLHKRLNNLESENTELKTFKSLAENYIRKSEFRMAVLEETVKRGGSLKDIQKITKELSEKVAKKGNVDVSDILKFKEALDQLMEMFAGFDTDT